MTGRRDARENRLVRDDDLRSSCFASLDVLLAKHGPDVPYEALRAGFNFRGRRVPFLNRAYRDEPTPDGVLYAYHGPIPTATSIGRYAAPSCSTFRSCTSSVRGRTGTGRSIRRSSKEVRLLDAAHIVGDAEAH